MAIENLQEVLKKLDEIKKATEKGVTEGLKATSLRVIRDAKSRCKSQTNGKGLLAASITAEIENNKATIGTNVKYAPYVELGTGLFAKNGDGRQDVPWHYIDAKGKWHTTSGQHPKPFLQPALDANRKNAEKDIANEIKRSLKEVEK